MSPTAAQRRAALGSAARWRAAAGRVALVLALFAVGEAEAQQRRGRRRAAEAEQPAATPSAEAAPLPPTGPVLGPELPPAAVGEGSAAGAAPGSGQGGAEGQAPAPLAPSGPSAAAGPVPPREAEDETYDRLFGAEPAGEAGEAAPTPAPKPPSLPFESPVWVWAVIVGLGLAWVAGKVWERRRVVVAPASLRVISSTPLGRDGHISVVEVKDADGALRRMLVGHGGGAPRLIAELDGLREFGAVEAAADRKSVV